jgi:uncharacterized protein (TIGR03437 family)
VKLRLSLVCLLGAAWLHAATTSYEVLNRNSGLLTGIALTGGSTGTITSSVSGYDMAIDSSGNFIIASGSLYRVNSAGTNTIIAAGPAGGGFLSVAVDSTGNFICADNVTHRVFRVSSNGASVVPVATYPITDTNELEDVVVRVDPGGNYIVAHDNNGFHMARITPAGVVTPLTLTGSTPNSAGGLTFDALGNYVVEDYNANTLYTVTPAGVSAVLVASSALNRPIGIVRDPSTNNYIVTSQGSNAVLAVSAFGTIQTLLSGSPLSNPSSVVLTNPNAGPIINQVLNNYSLIPDGFPNSGISPGALFIIKGAGLADPTAPVVLQSSAAPGLKSTLNGATVKVTVNGTAVTPVFYYAIVSQLALVLPSNTPLGAATVTVSYGGQTSAPAQFQVVQTAMGFDAYYGSGTGLGVATDNVTGAVYNYTNSVPVGATIVLWGSGLGADAARDVQYAPANFPINNLAHLYIGGVEVPILYQGASGYPGVNQVDVTIPVGVPVGCAVPVVGVTAAGLPTNIVTLPIGIGGCVDSFIGLSATQLQNYSAQPNVRNGLINLKYGTTGNPNGGGVQIVPSASASFQDSNGAPYRPASNDVTVGGCVTLENALGSSSGILSVGLDAGTITAGGPGSNPFTLGSNVTGGYFSNLPSGFIPAAGGTFTFTGGGGASVGAFNSSIVFPTPFMTWTNQAAAASITRSAGLPVTWTGGPAGSFVNINGISSVTVNGQQLVGGFYCLVPATANQFTVPSYILNALPAGTGGVTVTNTTSHQPFQAPGLTYGLIYATTALSANGTFN